MSDPRCAKCGHPRSNHPYRHPFVGPSLEDDVKALEAKLAKVVAAAGKMLDAFCVHEDSHQSAAYEAMCAALAETERESHD